MGNRFSVTRLDMIGLTTPQKKAIWNREWYAKVCAKRVAERTNGKGGGTQAATDARSEQAEYVRELKPPGIVGVCPDEVWWRTNDASFKRGLAAASQRRDG